MAGTWFHPGTRRGFAGLRAGWRVAVFIVIVTVPLVGLSLFLDAVPANPWTDAIGNLAAPAVALGATWVLARLERRPFGSYGLRPRSAFGAQFWRGVIWGGAALSLLLGLIFACGDFQFGHLSAAGSTLGAPALKFALVFFGVGLAEEALTRGYALVTLAEGMGFWPAAILLSVVFGALHLPNSGEDVVGVLAAGLIGLFFCFTFRRSGSLWFAVGLHAAWDYCESFVYGVPDSGGVLGGRMLVPSFHGSHWITGGSVGPEGSLWVFAVIAALFGLFYLQWPQPHSPELAA